MSNRKRNNKKKKEKTQHTHQEGGKKSTSLPPVELTLAEATLVYELMHDVKVTYMSMTENEKSKEQVKNMVSLCNKIMKKVEKVVINGDKGGSPQ